jgi:hypothetical protein
LSNFIFFTSLKKFYIKPFLLSLFITLSFACFAQEERSLKRDNLFIATELSKALGANSFDKKYGLSFVYNRLLPNTRLGVGAGLEMIDIRTKRLGGLMPVLDVRYYATLGKSTLMPIAQVGYNVYNFKYQKFGTTQSFEEKGGLGYSVGIGYSYPLTKNGNGLYGAFRFRGLQYKYNDPSIPFRTNTSERLNVSLGWRF